MLKWTAMNVPANDTVNVMSKIIDLVKADASNRSQIADSNSAAGRAQSQAAEGA